MGRMGERCRGGGGGRTDIETRNEKRIRGGCGKSLILGAHPR